jgi:hypothetical protein
LRQLGEFVHTLCCGSRFRFRAWAGHHRQKSTTYATLLSI